MVSCLHGVPSWVEVVVAVTVAVVAAVVAVVAVVVVVVGGRGIGGSRWYV